MRLDYLSQDNFVLFVNSCYFKDIDWEDKESIARNVKRLISFIDCIYHVTLQGFYRMNVYVHPLIGTFLEMEKDDFDFEFSSIDLKITIYLAKPFYLEVTDFFLLPECDEVYFYHDNYYVNLDHISYTPSLLEFGNIVYGDFVDSLIKNGILLKQKKIDDDSIL